MKNLILLTTAILISAKSIAQFPSPTNFNWHGIDVMIDDWSVCNDEVLNGPGYCTTIFWNPPDTSETNADLIGYNIYYHELDAASHYIFSTTKDTTITFSTGIAGKMWVTALYENPSGESGPSNIIENNDLPISIKRNRTESTPVKFNRSQLTIEIKEQNLKGIAIYNIKGQQIKNYEYPQTNISIDVLPDGIYIVKTKNSDNKQTIIKIIK